MVPCFQVAETLPTALASVRAQTYPEWEGVCVDDGSSDQTWQILRNATAADSRFRVERFERNRGRGAARQRILELARGDYLTFLDADDWMYPERVERELRWLEADRRIAAVSVGAAVTREPHELVGTMRPRARTAMPCTAVFERPVPPPLLFPTTMIRMDVAKRTGFDPQFRRSQDSDFLIRALLGRHYVLLDDLLYAYSQGVAATLPKTLEGYSYRMRAHLRHFSDHPGRVARTVAATAMKMAVFRAAGAVGLHERLIRQRWRDADYHAQVGFRTAWERVLAARAEFPL